MAAYNKDEDRDLRSLGYLTGLLEKGRDRLKGENREKIERQIRRLRKRLGKE